MCESEFSEWSIAAQSQGTPGMAMRVGKEHKEFYPVDSNAAQPCSYLDFYLLDSKTMMDHMHIDFSPII